MKLPDSLTSVTPLSKTLALVLFVLLPFVGFYLGYRYRQTLIVTDVKFIEEPVAAKISIETAVPQRNLQEVCGNLPNNINIYKDHFTQVIEPKWSPDCRHLAWSVWQSGPAGVDYSGPHNYVGLFLYEDKTGKTDKIYTPKEDETIELQEWLDSTSLTFIKDGQKKIYTYSLVDKTTQ